MIDHIFTQTREEAVEVGQMLLNHGALRHASLQGAPFADGRQLYQFLVRLPPRAPTTPSVVHAGTRSLLTNQGGDSLAAPGGLRVEQERVPGTQARPGTALPTTVRRGKHVRGSVDGVDVL